MAAARNQVKHTWPAIAGYTIGCGLGAGTTMYSGFGPWGCRQRLPRWHA
jgi:hypothetical protein